MELDIAVAGMPTFRFVVPSPPPGASQVPCRFGESCPAAARADRCLAKACIAPVLDYFSDVVSYETVLVVCEAGGRKTCFEETGQRAAFRLLLAGITQSGCPLFSRFAALPVHAPLSSAYAAFSRLLRTLAAQSGRESAFAARRIGEELERHLAPILGEAKRKVRQDAAVNACVLMINGLRLATDQTRSRLGSQARRLGVPALSGNGDAGAGVTPQAAAGTALRQ